MHFKIAELQTHGGIIGILGFWVFGYFVIFKLVIYYNNIV